jgi:hypothetical protein
MNVNRYTLRIPRLSENAEVNETVLTIPLTMGTQNVDQSDIIKTNFIDVETEKAINPIVDWEQARFTPVKSFAAPLNNLLNSITYTLNLLDDKKEFKNATYEDASFSDLDIKNRKNGFTKSFLRLNFYDSDITPTQKLVAFLTIYPKIDDKFYNNNNSPSKSFFSSPNQNATWGAIKSVNTINLEFTVGNSLLDKRKDGEGFFLYYFRDEVSGAMPKELFMKATFNNAKTGKRTRLMSTSKKLFIDELIKQTNVTNLKNN